MTPPELVLVPRVSLMADYQFIANASRDVRFMTEAFGLVGVLCVSTTLASLAAYLVWYGLGSLNQPTEKSTLGGAAPPPLHALQHNITHMAIIMDGNRRYGRKHAGALMTTPAAEEEIHRCYRILSEGKLPLTDANHSWLQDQCSKFERLIRFTPLDGHRLGGEKLFEFILHCIEARINMLTVYAFSTDNWNRPALEVNVLLTLLYFFFDRMRVVARREGFFIRFIVTEPEQLPPVVMQLMECLEEESRQVSPRRITVNVCVSYSGQSEVVRACQRIAQRRVASLVPGDTPRVTRVEVENEMLRSVTQDRHEEEDSRVFSNLVPRGPQLLLRSSGEQRLSNFLSYETAYTELVFVPKMWPELTKEDLRDAIYTFSKRTRRMGK